MSVEYRNRPKSSNEMRQRGWDLETGVYYSPSESINNISMLCNMLGQTMQDLADALDRIEELENRTVPYRHPTMPS